MKAQLIFPRARYRGATSRCFLRGRWSRNLVNKTRGFLGFFFFLSAARELHLEHNYSPGLRPGALASYPDVCSLRQTFTKRRLMCELLFSLLSLTKKLSIKILYVSFRSLSRGRINSNDVDLLGRYLHFLEKCKCQTFCRNMFENVVKCVW